MRDMEALRDLLRTLDGAGYGAYKRIKGSWRLPDFVLRVDHVQGDPFAAPSAVALEVEAGRVGLPADGIRNAPRALATASYLARALASRAAAAAGRSGSGRSGDLVVEAPGQEVLPQTAVQVRPDGSVEARLGVGLPARGRRILGAEAVRLLLEVLPELARAALLSGAHDHQAILRHAEANEDAGFLRALLPSLGLVAFVAEGARLPRRSGVDDRPLEGPEVVPFRTPPSLEVEVELPNRGRVRGMGLPRGVTLVVGGGFHGKSTLLRALQAGVVNHVPDDGRELVVTVPDAVKIRAEDGRSVAGVDISPFIDGLPLGQDTRAFTTANASGSTSQAASLAEALEAGCRTLLMDEDTCATNFMIRDRRMQALVPKAGEPITPLVDRIREMSEVAGVSSVLVLGGSGDYLDVADTVLAFRDYVPADATPEARRVAGEVPTGRAVERAAPFGLPVGRRPARGSVDPSGRRRATLVKVPDERTLVFGSDTVDVAAVEQLAGRSQLRAIGAALAVAAREMVDGRATLPEILDAVERRLEEGGLDALDPRRPGDLAGFRRHELAAVMNRIRSLRVD